METTEVLPFSNRYEAILKEYGIKPADLKTKIPHLAPAIWYKYQGGTKPGYEALEALLNLLPDLSPDYLLRGVGPMKRQEGESVPLQAPPRDVYNELVQLRVKTEFQENRIKELEDLVNYFKPERSVLHGAMQKAGANFSLLSNGPRAKSLSRFQCDAEMLKIFSRVGNVQAGKS